MIDKPRRNKFSNKEMEVENDEFDFSILLGEDVLIWTAPEWDYRGKVVEVFNLFIKLKARKGDSKKYRLIRKSKIEAISVLR